MDNVADALIIQTTTVYVHGTCGILLKRNKVMMTARRKRILTLADSSQRFECGSEPACLRIGVRFASRTCRLFDDMKGPDSDGTDPERCQMNYLSYRLSISMSMLRAWLCANASILQFENQPSFL